MIAARPRGLALLRAGLTELSDLVLARSCAGCAAPGVRWCAACAAVLNAAVLNAAVLNAELNAGMNAATLNPEKLHRVLAGTLSVWSAVPYEGPVREAVNGWKDHGRVDLTPVFAAALRPVLADVAAGLITSAGRRWALVPVPSSPRSTRQRGRDPVRELCQAVGRQIPRERGVRRPLVVPALRQERRVAEQPGLSAIRRIENVTGALGVAPGWSGRLRGHEVLVVDDIVTSGASLLEATRALRAAGVRVHGALTLAATPLYHRPLHHPPARYPPIG